MPTLSMRCARATASSACSLRKRIVRSRSRHRVAAEFQQPAGHPLNALSDDLRNTPLRQPSRWAPPFSDEPVEGCCAAPIRRRAF